MTEAAASSNGSIVGRKKEFPVRILLPLSSEMAGMVDASLKNGEARVDLIREAIERELKRRETEPDKPA